MNSIGPLRPNRRQRRALRFDRAIFAELVIYIVGDHVIAWAFRLGHTCESRIRGWKKGRGLPHKWQVVLQVMGVLPDIVFWGAEERTRWLEENVPKGQPPPPIKNDATHCSTLEKAYGGDETEAGSTAICVFLDPVEFVSNVELRARIRVHLRRGVNFLFIVPRSFPAIAQLLAAIKSLKTREDKGCARVAVVDRAWKRPKAAVLVVKPEVPFTKDGISEVKIEDVVRASAQMWELGDNFRPNRKIVVRERRNYLFIPDQDTAEVLSRMPAWLASAEWE